MLRVLFIFSAHFLRNSCYFACDVFCFLSFNSQNSDIWNEECLVWVCKSTPNLWTSFPSVLETFQKYDRLCRAARVISPDMSLWSWTCFVQRLLFMSFISFEEIAKCETWNENVHKHCARFRIQYYFVDYVCNMDRKQIITPISNQNVVILLQDSAAYVQHHSKFFILGTHVICRRIWCTLRAKFLFRSQFCLWLEKVNSKF